MDESILFSLGFLSRNYLWKLSLNRGYKGIYIIGWEGMWKVIFCVCFSLCLFSYIALCLCWTCLHPYVTIFIDCMFGWSFAVLCDHCSHFYMTVLVYDQVAHMFHIIFTWSQFTCYIILVLLLLTLPWEFNVFCASVSGHRYLCSKFIIAPMTHDRGGDMIREVFIFVLCVLYLFCTHVAFVSF